VLFRAPGRGVCRGVSTAVIVNIRQADAASLAYKPPGVRACLRSVAACATSTGFAGHAGATANLKLTFHPDHSVGANQFNSRIVVRFPEVEYNTVTIPSTEMNAELIGSFRHLRACLAD
jgi:hypothetical protein